jgi:pimeloyl-ACP methyl ester carboxylesterase
VPVADATLAYQEHGAGDPLLLIHGFSTTGEAWDDLLPSFVDR